MSDIQEKIMLEDLYAEPCIIGKCHRDNKDEGMDIYVSAESLRVFENAWVEGMSPNIPGPAMSQHPGMDTTAQS